MSRLARVVVADYPYHVTHRGNRCDDVFFAAEDRHRYRMWLAENAAKFHLDVWAYSLMTNHVHLLVVPRRKDSLARGIGRAHLRYASWINWRQGWSGHLWANRFYSAPLDDAHLWAAVKYVENNPVRAGVVQRAADYDWSSARAHALGQPDPLLSSPRPFPDPARLGDWSAWLAEQADEEILARLRTNTCTGRPCGSEGFVALFEKSLGRVLAVREMRGQLPHFLARRSDREEEATLARNEVTVPSFQEQS